MRRIVCRLAVVYAVLSMPLCAVARDVYVAKEGDDANPGTKDKPLASISKAVELVRGAGPGTIWVGPGEHYLERGLAFDARHAGTAAQPLVLRGIEPGKVRLTGARAVGNFRPLTAEEARPFISPQAKQHVVVADLPYQAFPPLGPLPDKHRDHGQEEVVCGDRPMQSARWPNAGFVEFDKVIDSGASGVTHWVSRTVYRPGSFQFPGERAKSWDFRRGVWLHGFWCYEWSDEVLKAASYDPATGELRLAAKHAYGIGSPCRKDSKHPFYAREHHDRLQEAVRSEEGSGPEVARPGEQCRVAVDGLSRVIRGWTTSQAEALEAARGVADSARLRADPVREGRPASRSVTRYLSAVPRHGFGGFFANASISAAPRVRRYTRTSARRPWSAPLAPFPMRNGAAVSRS
jgi:hypothetical protein